MQRTTIFVPDDLARRLRERARRAHRPQAELVREALARYLDEAPRPRPRSVGLGASRDPDVTSENVKHLAREEWAREWAERADPR
ncbi:MAG: ribbon-helix-helix protein, CopG family [bacterium]|jgi:plasmid stability protein|nr:ribbon-helix-helix protein, CopG family [bacterium]